MRISYDKLPEHMRSGARLYIEKGIQPGGFLTAILTNDLRMAARRADHINQHLLATYVEWLTWDIPLQAHGSQEKVRLWIEQGGLEGSDLTA